jgi:transcription-repair coupling factor (superfamily II helicase)
MLALYLVREWKSSDQNGLIFLARDERRAEQLGAILQALLPDCASMVLPRLDALPFDAVEPSRDIAGRRASVLRRLAVERRPPILVTTVEAVGQRVPALGHWKIASLRIREGEAFDQSAVENFFAQARYQFEDRVEAPGETLILGQSIEVYPAGALAPLRIECEAGRISGIAVYDSESQSTIANLQEVVLDPMSEWAEVITAADDERNSGLSSSTVFEYLPAAKLFADFRLEARVANWIEQIDEARRESSSGDARKAFLSADEWKTTLGDRKPRVLPQSSHFEEVPRFATAASPSKALRAFLTQQEKLARSIVFTAASEADLRVMDRRAGGASERCANWSEATKGRRERTSLIVDFDRGFVTSGRQPKVIVSAPDLLGSRASHHDAVALNSAGRDIASVAPGDVVVHVNRGVCILRGLETFSAPGLPEGEMVRLEFADQSAVLVPTEELASIWRYSSDNTAITLDDADGSSWQQRRTEVEQEIAQTASHLLKIAADRANRTAPKLLPPAQEYERFASRFPYFPTTDQSRAIEDVLEDISSGHPMDRLVCGDVGYGKTEVALRATAAAVFAGKQVAIAVPTTVLARQHLETFRKRFAPFAIRVGHLSRFASAEEVRDVKKSLSDGSLRVVIGTHALASKTIRFADLGLVVIDEEQRFGAADKAKLAGLAENVHLLTMTATPIPRTLAEAYAGLRSISIISTPPVRRWAVKTTVEPFSEAKVAAALRREHARRGGSFVVCPRIGDIVPMQQRLAATVPELKLVAVHGRMPAAQIDEAMMSFAQGRSDILLTTNIVENGLDIPRANTIIVWRPEKFGLAQLHQLRGRVGRTSTRSFAYFLTDQANLPNATSRRRLNISAELARPGAGLEISEIDLDLRGTGDFLSRRQSGHVKALGPALYRHLLQRAFRQANAKMEDDRPQLHLEVPAFLPEGYISNEGARLDVYARIWKSETQADVEDVEDELQERFGDLVPEARNLITLASIELDCRRLAIVKLEAGPDSIAATLRDRSRVGRTPRPPRQKQRVRPPHKSGTVLRWKNERLVFRRPTDQSNRLNEVRKFVDIIERKMGG